MNIIKTIFRLIYSQKEFSLIENQLENDFDSICHFPIDLEPNKIQFSLNQSENYKYNPIPVDLTRIRKYFSVNKERIL